LNWQITNNL